MGAVLRKWLMGPPGLGLSPAGLCLPVYSGNNSFTVSCKVQSGANLDLSIFE